MTKKIEIVENPKLEEANQRVVDGFGNHLATLMVKTSFSPNTLAEATGMAPDGVRKLLSAKRFPSLKTLCRMATAMNLPVRALLDVSAKH